jgi:hypothetical protein
MNLTDYLYLTNSHNAVNEQQTLALEKIVTEFPFFQSARALRLKGLYNQDSFRYNFELKITAAYTTDRSVLFDYITSNTFTAIHKNLYQEKVAEIHDILVVESEIIPTEEDQQEENKHTITNPLELSILTSIKESAPIEEIDLALQKEAGFIETTTDQLELGKPLAFSKFEKHSFQEWLQLSKIKPIERTEVAKSEKELSEIEKKKKTELIDKFIETSPKIPPVKQDATPKILVEQSKEDTSYLMTETLARVYLEQKKYQKAIQAYEILILKYPEKISFFADRISDIKILQQNNK